MVEGKQSRLSPAQKADVWRRWKAGESLHGMGRAYGRPHNCIRCVLLPRGGIAPAVRQRSGIARDSNPGICSAGLFSGMGLTTEAHKNVTHDYFNAGYLVNIDQPSLNKLKKDVDELFDAASH